MDRHLIDDGSQIRDVAKWLPLCKFPGRRFGGALDDPPAKWWVGEFSYGGNLRCA